MPRSGTLRVLVLYTELAPYVLAGLERLVAEHNAKVVLVRWPVNAEAPFHLKFAEGIEVYERRTLSDKGLLQLAQEHDPHITLCAGWIDKGYVRVCRKLRAVGKLTVLCSDTAWRGDLRQWVATVVARLVFPRIFSHAWVTGLGQHRYAQRLGFAPARIRTGFYAADTAYFLGVGEALLDRRKERWPHRFLCVARYIAAKDQQLLCDAFAALCGSEGTEDWELWFAGTGELFDQISGSASGSHPRIKHLGFVQSTAMQDVLDQCGVFVLPSNYEPWGVVVQEHACAGFPLLLSDRVMAAERFLDEGGNGHAFTSGDAGALRITLRRFMSYTDGQLREMAQRSVQLGRSWGPSEWALTVKQMSTERP